MVQNKGDEIPQGTQQGLPNVTTRTTWTLGLVVTAIGICALASSQVFQSRLKSTPDDLARVVARAGLGDRIRNPTHYLLSQNDQPKADVGLGRPKVDYNRDILPILANNCFTCHGQDKEARKAGLRLDVRELAVKPAKSGAAPIQPGKSAESEVVQRIFATDATERMPPKNSNKSLTAADKELIKQFRFMTRLFSSCRQRLDRTSDEREVRHLLRALGCACLEEHAEWILLHRDRPLEASALSG